MTQYTCLVCGYVYDPAHGDPDQGIEPGTSFEDLPEDWECPVCGTSVMDFEEINSNSPVVEEEAVVVDDDDEEIPAEDEE